MAINKDNLIPMSERTKDEVRQIATMGGIASGKARKEKATMKKTLEMMLDIVPNIKENKEQKTFRELSTEGLMIGAVQGKAENYKLIMQVLGEMEESKDTPNIEIKIIDNQDLEKTMYEEKED